MTHKFNVVIVWGILLIFLLIPGSMDLIGQSEQEAESDTVLTFKELPRLKSKSIPINGSPDRLSIVDINSRIAIYVNKSLVRKQALKLVGAKTPQDLVDQMDGMTEILHQQASILELLGSGDHFTLEERKKNLNRFSEKMLKLLKFLNQDPEFRKKVNAALSTPSKNGGEYREIFALVDERLQGLQSQLKMSYSGVRFRLGAWLKGKSGEHPLHIDGFDTYGQGNFFQYPFFTLPTSEEVREKFKALRDAANRFNTGGVSALLNIKQNLQKLDNFLKTELETSTTCMKTALENAKNAIKQQVVDLPLPKTRAFLTKIKEIRENIKSIRQHIKSIKASPADLETQIEAIREIRDLVSLIKQGVKFLQDEWGTIKEELIKGAKTLTSEIKAIVQTQLDIVSNTCFTGLINFVKTIGGDMVGFFDNFNNSMLMLSEQSKSALKLGEDVTRLLIDNIPEVGTLDLRFAGRRSDNDEVYIKAVLEQQPPTGTAALAGTATLSSTATPAINSQPLKIGDKVLVLYKIVAIKLTPGLIFADAFKNENVSFNKKFQASPSYNVILSFGNRKSISWNRFLKIGIGINVAALDFNQDSTRELGLGVVLSAFKDFFHIGVGRNMQFDQWYWFFGLKLPWGNLSIPTTSVNPK
jgi:hypothetical protein